jgi:hypothetical protein
LQETRGYRGLNRKTTFISRLNRSHPVKTEPLPLMSQLFLLIKISNSGDPDPGILPTSHPLAHHRSPSPAGSYTMCALSPTGVQSSPPFPRTHAEPHVPHHIAWWEKGARHARPGERRRELHDRKRKEGKTQHDGSADAGDQRRISGGSAADQRRISGGLTETIERKARGAAPSVADSH